MRSDHAVLCALCLQREVILADFDIDSECGDRRQEIVFIGAGMDREAISAQLDSALLTDAGGWLGGRVAGVVGGGGGRHLCVG